MIDMDDSTFALWALVERLEALVEIGDAMEEVADLWANTLAFGGQPVGGLGTGDAEPAPATRHAWMCDRSEGCVLMKGHGSECVFPGPNHCQCVKPDYDASDVCGKCGFVKGEIV
jgi:hypothetical protein